MSISFQLYSAREFQPWEDMIATLASLGYTNVEGFGGVYEDPARFRALLESHGMKMQSGHFFPIGQFEDHLDKTISTAKALGMERVFCPAPEDDLRGAATAEAWVSLAKRLEEAGKKVRDAGFRFGWHNHHWEFMPLPGGDIPMQLILENAPTIEWEADIAWIVRGNADPIEWINKHADRITTAHVKDIAPHGECEDEDGWADVGHGTMDWAAIMKALQAAGTDLFVIEHDKPNDAERFARRSINNLRALMG